MVLAGKEYGSGSSRDWAAKGTALLGVRAVIAESYERIHRSNLIGMGVLPLQFPEGETAQSLGLTGEETFDVTGVEALNEGGIPQTVHGQGRRHGVRRRSCASTPPERPTTTATAASCSTSCAPCSPRAEQGGEAARKPRPHGGTPQTRTARRDTIPPGGSVFPGARVPGGPGVRDARGCRGRRHPLGP